MPSAPDWAAPRGTGLAPANLHAPEGDQAAARVCHVGPRRLLARCTASTVPSRRRNGRRRTRTSRTVRRGGPRGGSALDAGRRSVPPVGGRQRAQRIPPAREREAEGWMAGGLGTGDGFWRCGGFNFVHASAHARGGVVGGGRRLTGKRPDRDRQRSGSAAAARGEQTRLSPTTTGHAEVSPGE